MIEKYNIPDEQWIDSIINVESNGPKYLIYFNDGSVIEVGYDGMRAYVMGRYFENDTKLSANVNCLQINRNWLSIYNFRRLRSVV